MIHPNLEHCTASGADSAPSRQGFAPRIGCVVPRSRRNERIASLSRL